MSTAMKESAPSAAAKRAAAPRMEIRVQGEVDLGQELLLEPVAVFDDRSTPDYLRTLDSTLSPADNLDSSLPNEDLEYMPETYALQPGTGRLCLKDQGLVLQYGILGKPGCGKTHLLMHLLRQIIAHKQDDSELKYGGLILDPKAALIDDVRKAFARANRDQDLVVINTRELQDDGGVNIIDCMLAPGDLGETLVLAAKSAGFGASDPFWIQQMTAAFGAILTLMAALVPDDRATLGGLMHIAVGSDDGRPALDSFLNDAEKKLKGNQTVRKAAAEFRTAVDALRAHASVGPGAGDPKNRITVEQFMQQAFGVFRAPGYACYSKNRPDERSLYDLILDEGKFVLVSMGAQEVKLSSLLPALMKLIFQRTVISRFDRFRNAELHNCTRPVLFMADEYHTIATKMPGAFGDSEFFSLARQFGALSFVATQSVQQLMVSSLKEAWKAVFDVLSAVIVMSGNDPETAEYVDKLAGKKVVIVKKRAPSFNEGKESIGVSFDRQELPVIPVGTLQMLTQGQAIVVGKVGGQKEASAVRYLSVPPAPED
jgi:hypothetical protein